MAIVVTLGFALPLAIVLPPLTVALWALLPTVLLWGGRGRSAGVASTLALLALVFYGPVWFAQRGASYDLAHSGDIAAASQSLRTVEGIEIRRPAVSGLWEERGIGSGPCFDLCEQLLLGGATPWVRVVFDSDRYDNYPVDTKALFVAADSASCHAVNADVLSGDSCVLYARDHGRAAELTLALVDGFGSDEIKRGRFYWPFARLTAEATMRSKGDARVLFRRTQLFDMRPSGYFGFYVGHLGAGEAGQGFALARHQAASPAIDVAEFTTLGFALRPARSRLPGSGKSRLLPPPPDVFDTARIASMLAIGPEDRPMFSNVFAQEARYWISAAHNKPALTVAETAVFCSVLRSDALPDYPWSKGVLDMFAQECS